jgi:hypothetical protein
MKTFVEPNLQCVLNGTESKPFPHYIRNRNTSSRGTQSGTQYVVMRYKTLQNLGSAANHDPKPHWRKC